MQKFVGFHYAELKTLGKYFLALISPVLAFSVTFSDKITEIFKTPLWERILLSGSWSFLIVAVITSGAGLYYNFVAGAQAQGAIISVGRQILKYL